MLSVELLHIFLMNGRYMEMVENKKKLELLREQIKQYQLKQDLKEMRWIKEGVVGCFESVKVYEENKQGLNELLMHIGVLPLVVDVDWKDIAEHDKKQLIKKAIPQLPTVRFTPTKQSRLHKDQLNAFNQSIQRMKLSTQVLEWKNIKIKLDILENEWTSLKHQLKYELKPDVVIKWNIGTLTCRSREPLITGETLHSMLGSDAVVQYGSVNSNKLMTYLAKGFVSKLELNLHRQIKGVNLRYILKLLPEYK